MRSVELTIMYDHELEQLVREEFGANDWSFQDEVLDEDGAASSHLFEVNRDELDEEERQRIERFRTTGHFEEAFNVNLILLYLVVMERLPVGHFLVESTS